MLSNVKLQTGFNQAFPSDGGVPVAVQLQPIAAGNSYYITVANLCDASGVLFLCDYDSPGVTIWAVNGGEIKTFGPTDRTHAPSGMWVSNPGSQGTVNVVYSLVQSGGNDAAPVLDFGSTNTQDVSDGAALRLELADVWADPATYGAYVPGSNAIAYLTVRATEAGSVYILPRNDSSSTVSPIACFQGSSITVGPFSIENAPQLFTDADAGTEYQYAFQQVIRE